MSCCSKSASRRCPRRWLPALTAQLAPRLEARLTEERLPAKAPVETLQHAAASDGVRRPELTERQDDRDETGDGPAGVARRSTPTAIRPVPALGFARKLGVEFDALDQRRDAEGQVPLVRKRHLRGRATVDVLPEVLAGVLRDLPFPEADALGRLLEDGKGEFLFGRPVRWLLFLYGGRVVPFTIARAPRWRRARGCRTSRSGAVTYGHRFLATSGRAGRAIKVRSFDEYRKRLAENFVDPLAHRAARPHRARPRSAGAAARRARDAARRASGRGTARRGAGPRRVSRPSCRRRSPRSSSRCRTRC